MPTLPTLILRFAADQQSRQPLVAVGSDPSVILFKGVPAKIRVAEFNGTPSADTLVDVTGNTAATLVVRRLNATGTKLIQKVTNTVTTGLTYSDWVAGTSQHYEFALSATDLAIALPSYGKLAIYGVLSVTTPSGEIVLGHFLGTLEMSGYATDDLSSPAPADGNYVIEGGVLKLWNPDQQIYQAVFPSGTEGQENVAVG